MYCGWAKLQNAEADIIDISHGKHAGIRQATIALAKPGTHHALSAEYGVHRLSRVSDFDPDGWRHTSFARVTVIPDLPKRQEPDLNQAHIKVHTFRASGPGGQHVQKSATAVRLVHLPTGITAQAQSERSQRQNLQHAMRVLAARINEAERVRDAELAREFRGTLPPASWSNQVRSYILNPKQMVKDHRTGHVEHDAQSVLTGGVQPFIDAYHQNRAGRSQRQNRRHQPPCDNRRNH